MFSAEEMRKITKEQARNNEESSLSRKQKREVRKILRRIEKDMIDAAVSDKPHYSAIVHIRFSGDPEVRKTVVERLKSDGYLVGMNRLYTSDAFVLSVDWS